MPYFHIWKRNLRPTVTVIALSSFVKEVACDFQSDSDEFGVAYEKDTVINNWSGTYKFRPSKVFLPKTLEELQQIVENYNNKRNSIRPIGSALSPNGIGMSSDGKDCVNLAAIDGIHVNVDAKRVTVGSGTTVSEVLKELKRFNLTLQNFSSIQEQQMGGWTQVAAHGTGIALPTVEEQIISMKVLTPTKGILTLPQSGNQDQKQPTVFSEDYSLFNMMKVGLGSLGIITELTLQCIDRFNLFEESFVLTRDEVMANHVERLRQYRHVRYMWFPYSNYVVVVVSNPTDLSSMSLSPASFNSNHSNSKGTPGNASAPEAAKSKSPIQVLGLELLSALEEWRGKTGELEEKLLSWTVPQIRDLLLDINPLDTQLVRRINQAEALSWVTARDTTNHHHHQHQQNNHHSYRQLRIADSTDVLGFECGGQQLVFEVCFPCPDLAVTVTGPSGETTGTGEGFVPTTFTSDVAYVRDLLEVVERAGLPAPGPIEQRWTARSTAPMSPAFSKNPNDIFSWVGVIMYLPPSQTPSQRLLIRKVFDAYRQLLYPVMEKYGAVVHWGKICLPDSQSKEISVASETENILRQLQTTWYSPYYGKPEKEVEFLRRIIRRRFPVDYFNSLRESHDSNNILSNELINILFAG